MKGGSIVDVERVKERNKRVAKANAELKKIISYNVRYYRTIRGMNEDELASYLGKKGQYIKKLENRELKANPPIDTIGKIAWALGVPFVAIIKDRNEKNEKNYSNAGGFCRLLRKYLRRHGFVPKQLLQRNNNLQRKSKTRRSNLGKAEYED